ncbi:PadR family transcriptional regulator [Latilactobacillus sakei]|uniref:Transcriptional regulator PadR-like family protein n=1 Tax=Latilactobacillus sakei TaxID=1599 RepID=A0AAE8J4S7_LATSK|nr:PadR family transcriptional regulator [Latilactobacillus sakei]MCE8501888.1 PadR family transcriptional regulator [Latilactobacillus sakei]SPE21152.1 Transcriptional regulator PadR-like family protein [Latilactobacillus sakei]
MNAQLKKGLLEFCVLATLKKANSYGYQIIKDTSSVIEISDSTLYPILKRLEKQEQIESYQVAHNGRLRKYFHLTPIGAAAIEQFLNEWTQVTAIYEYIKGEA